MSKVYFDQIFAKLLESPQKDSNEWSSAYTTVNANSATWSGIKNAGGCAYQLQFNNNNVLSGASTLCYNPTLSTINFGVGNVDTGYCSNFIVASASTNNGSGNLFLGGTQNCVSLSASYVNDYGSNIFIGGCNNKVYLSGCNNTFIGGCNSVIESSSGSGIIGNWNVSTNVIRDSKNSFIFNGVANSCIINSENSTAFHAGRIINSCNSFAHNGTMCCAVDSYVMGIGTILNAHNAKIYHSGIGQGNSTCICAFNQDVSGSFIASGIYSSIQNSNNAIIGAGYSNGISNNSTNSVIGAGMYNSIENSPNSIVGAGANGRIYGPGGCNVIGGGGDSPRYICGSSSMVGAGNNVGLSGNCSFIGTGNHSFIRANNSAILAGCCNTTCFDNTFLLGSYLTASKPDYTFVNNLSSQCVITTDGLFFTSLSAASAIYTTATQTCAYVSISVAGSALFLPLYRA